MEQSELNKKLQEAIHKEINWLYKSEDVTQPAATACEIICLQEKLTMLNLITYPYVEKQDLEFIIEKFKTEIKEQLNSLKKV